MMTCSKIWYINSCPNTFDNVHCQPVTELGSISAEHLIIEKFSLLTPLFVGYFYHCSGPEHLDSNVVIEAQHSTI